MGYRTFRCGGELSHSPFTGIAPGYEPCLFVPVRGLEPPRPLGHRFLKPGRLPVPPNGLCVIRIATLRPGMLRISIQLMQPCVARSHGAESRSYSRREARRRNSRCLTLQFGLHAQRAWASVRMTGGSNPRPSRWQRNALPAAPHPRQPTTFGQLQLTCPVRPTPPYCPCEDGGDPGLTVPRSARVADGYRKPWSLHRGSNPGPRPYRGRARAAEL